MSSMAKEKYHHGKTPAAWTGSVIATIGALIATVGFFLNINWPIVWVGLAVMAEVPIVGGIMVKMGYGHELIEEQH